MSKDNIFGYFTGSAAQAQYHNPWLAEKTKNFANVWNNFWNDIGTGFRNTWYNLTGQTEKTSSYQAQIEREDNAPVRQAQALEQAGLSKYTGGSTSVGTGTYGEGKPSFMEKSIQLASALMDLKSKQVGIDATQAGIRKSDAETGLIDKQVRTYDQKILADINQSLMQTAYIGAQKKLLEDQSPFIVEKTIAEVQHLSNQSALYLAQSDYYKSQKKLIDQQTGIASIERNLKQKDLEKYEYRFKMEVEKHSEAIAKSVADRNHLSYQDKLVVKDLAYRQLQFDFLQHDYDFSVSHNLRSNDQVSRILGINADAMAEHTVNNLRALWNFNGILGDKLGLPAMNDIIPIFPKY